MLAQLRRTRPTGRSTPIMPMKSGNPLSATDRQATAERSRALADRADSQAEPWLELVDVSYEHESSGDGGEGGRARPAFELPLGARERANAGRGWRDRPARLWQGASPLEEAFAARVALLELRERAAIAGCSRLAMTGIPPENWLREPPPGERCGLARRGARSP